MKRVLFAFMALALSSFGAMAQNKDITITLVETSDVHGSFFPYDFITRKPKAGSMARVATFVKDLRQKQGAERRHSARATHKLLLQLHSDTKGKYCCQRIELYEVRRIERWQPRYRDWAHRLRQMDTRTELSGGGSKHH